MRTESLHRAVEMDGRGPETVRCSPQILFFCRSADSSYSKLEYVRILLLGEFGRQLASVSSVPDSRTASTYNEPTVMWRMRRGDGLAMLMHLVIVPTPAGATAMWFVNGRELGMRDFAQWSDAIAWSDRVRDQNWTVGWRLASDNN